jgi:hypothetical protein
VRVEDHCQRAGGGGFFPRKAARAKNLLTSQEFILEYQLPRNATKLVFRNEGGSHARYAKFARLAKFDRRAEEMEPLPRRAG